ncbi:MULTISPECIES: hypothetical protein [unclassified Rhizobium]|uniref:hypothetical protein n=1 Tax=unclassified Rhizobium TaxID=2613769 RepID=UPI001AE82845|nr:MULTISPECIES: hypothetical protein [unclassified Rhizobium]MBP2461173.1 hypothetical protein [Rhizobium sp. PvP014]MBP2528569.1 hypothetical protein [Rhizobium sp. PvP099]
MANSPSQKLAYFDPGDRTFDTCLRRNFLQRVTVLIQNGLRTIHLETQQPLHTCLPAFANPSTEPTKQTQAKDTDDAANINPNFTRNPSETFLRGDIEISAEYRREYYKYILAISTTLLAFTVSFQPTLRVPPEHLWLEMIGWAGLGVAVAAGVRVHMVWSKFYAVTQKYLNKGKKEEGYAVRKRCHQERRILEVLMLVGLIIGVAGVVGFTAANLKNVAIKTDETRVPELETGG